MVYSRDNLTKSKDKMLYRSRVSPSFFVAGALFLALCYSYYQNQDIALKLRVAELHAKDMDKTHSSLKAQLEVISKHRADLEATLSKQTSSYKAREEDFISKISLCEMNISSTKHEAFNRFNALDTQYKMLQAKNEELQTTYEQMQQQYTRLSSDNHRTVESMSNFTRKLKQDKNNEIDTLKERVKELYESSESLRSELESSKHEIYSYKMKNDILQENSSKRVKSSKECLQKLKIVEDDIKQCQKTVDEAKVTIEDLKTKQNPQCNETIILKKLDLPEGLIPHKTSESLDLDSDDDDKINIKTKSIMKEITAKSRKSSGNHTPMTNMIKLKSTTTKRSNNNPSETGGDDNSELQLSKDSSKTNNGVRVDSKFKIDRKGSPPAETSFQSLVNNESDTDNTQLDKENNEELETFKNVEIVKPDEDLNNKMEESVKSLESSKQQRQIAPNQMPVPFKKQKRSNQHLDDVNEDQDFMEDKNIVHPKDEDGNENEENTIDESPVLGGLDQESPMMGGFDGDHVGDQDKQLEHQETGDDDPNGEMITDQRRKNHIAKDDTYEVDENN